MVNSKINHPEGYCYTAIIKDIIKDNNYTIVYKLKTTMGHLIDSDYEENIRHITLNGKEPKYNDGDNVIITDGDFSGYHGKVFSVNKDTCYVNIDNCYTGTFISKNNLKLDYNYCGLTGPIGPQSQIPINIVATATGYITPLDSYKNSGGGFIKFGSGKKEFSVGDKAYYNQATVEIVGCKNNEFYIQSKSGILGFKYK